MFTIEIERDIALTPSIKLVGLDDHENEVFSSRLNIEDAVELSYELEKAIALVRRG